MVCVEKSENKKNATALKIRHWDSHFKLNTIK